MQIRASISDWQDHVRAGVRYVQTAGKGLNRRNVFNNELVFQLAAMGIEKIIAGLCQFHGWMPTGHALSGLVVDLGSVCPLDEHLAAMIERVEAIDNMCTLAPERRCPPGDLEVEIALLAGREMAAFAGRHLPPKTIETTPSMGSVERKDESQ